MKQQPSTIQELFTRIALKYDLTNHITSMGLHLLWKRKLINLIPNNSTHLVDICAGTGAITLSALKNKPNLSKVTLIDFCPEMLEVAKKELLKTSIDFKIICEDAHSLSLKNESCDVVTLAYGFRNLKNPLSALNEIHRILKPGASFVMLELTKPNSFFLAKLHHFYLSYILPLLGGLITGDKKAYEYLSTSILNFAAPEEVFKMIVESNFHNVKKYPLFFGTAHLWIGTKK